MKIVQLLPTISLGDAVSNDAIALKRALRSIGYETGIYAESMDVRLPEGVAKHVGEMPALRRSDAILYHLSTGTRLNYELAQSRARKILIYHNITPPEYLRPYNAEVAKLCEEGLDGARFLADKVDYCLAVSEWNRQDLLELGYRCQIDVLPILIPFKDYRRRENSDVICRYQGTGTNILFTGRIAPNKCHEDLIASFYHFKKYYDPKARLFLVGSYCGMEAYYAKLVAYVKALGVEDVFFTGQVGFEEILAYYRVADVFLCASEHEGFCVPLVEAMYMGVPIVAYDSSAIAGTLGGSGILMKEKKPEAVAGMLSRLTCDQRLRQDVVQNQYLRLKDFDEDRIQKKSLLYLTEFFNKDAGTIK